MNEITPRDLITADGTYLFPPQTPGFQRIIEFSGDFGGGTLQLGHLSQAGDFVPFTAEFGGAPLEFTSADAMVVDTPATGRFVAYLTGSTSPSIQITFTTLPR